VHDGERLNGRKPEVRFARTAKGTRRASNGSGGGSSPSPTPLRMWCRCLLTVRSSRTLETRAADPRLKGAPARHRRWRPLRAPPSTIAQAPVVLRGPHTFEKRRRRLRSSVTTSIGRAPRGRSSLYKVEGPEPRSQRFIVLGGQPASARCTPWKGGPLKGFRARRAVNCSVAWGPRSPIERRPALGPQEAPPAPHRCPQRSSRGASLDALCP